VEFNIRHNFASDFKDYQRELMEKVKFTFLIFTCIGTLFASSSLFVDAQITPKWYILIGGAMLMGVCHIIQILQKDNHTSRDKINLLAMTGVVIIYSSFAQSLYGILQFCDFLSSTNAFPVTGCFDNPAGFAASLSASLPFGFLIFTQQKGYKRYVIILMIITIIVAVILSGSRSGILSISFLLVYWGFKRISYPLLLKWIATITLLIGLAIGLYNIRIESAEGRLFIWKCTLPMLKENYMTGLGAGGFEANYMKHQAMYFQTNPNSQYNILADNIQSPFCEYIRIVCDYGIIGLILLILITGFLLFCYLRHPSLNKEAAILCWGVVGIFSIFSYPSLYPFTWFILFYSTIILIQEPLKSIKKIQFLQRSKRYLILLYFILSVFTGYKGYQRIQAEIKWTKYANLAFLGKAKQLVPQYQELEKTLGNDRYFLYNYCNILYQAQDFEASLKIAIKCQTLWANYNLELLIGQIYENLQLYNNAENQYQLAHQMCPNRFLPLYHLALLFEKTQKRNKAVLLAQEIIIKPIKIPSLLIDNIKQEMNTYILNHSTK